jgi:hypothetical protein
MGPIRATGLTGVLDRLVTPEVFALGRAMGQSTQPIAARVGGPGVERYQLTGATPPSVSAAWQTMHAAFDGSSVVSLALAGAEIAQDAANGSLSGTTLASSDPATLHLRNLGPVRQSHASV